MVLRKEEGRRKMHRESWTIHIRGGDGHWRAVHPDGDPSPYSYSCKAEAYLGLMRLYPDIFPFGNDTVRVQKSAEWEEWNE
jgi:hypothetical protein